MKKENKKPNPNTVKGKVYALCCEQVNRLLSGVTIERIDKKHPLSGLRMLRELKKQGWIDYDVVDRARSIYFITWVRS